MKNNDFIFCVKCKKNTTEPPATMCRKCQADLVTQKWQTKIKINFKKK